jgi:hypothetical protein
LGFSSLVFSSSFYFSDELALGGTPSPAKVCKVLDSGALGPDFGFDSDRLILLVRFFGVG